MNQPAFKQQQLLVEAQRLHAAGEPGAALAVYERLHKLDPKNPRLLYLLGAAEMSLGRTTEARSHLTAALSRAPGDAAAWHDLAMVQKRDGRFKEALAALDRALAIRPADPTLCAARSGVCFMMGDMTGAAAALEPVMHVRPPHPSVAMAVGRLASRLGRQEEAIGLLRECLSGQGVPMAIRPDLHFQLGAILDGRGVFDAAFEAFRQAHAPRAGRYDAGAYSAAVEAAIGSWTPGTFASLPRGRNPTERPVFIVGMPRSGTSLVEQILASHPQVFGAGELDDIGRSVYELTGRVGGVMPPLADPSKLTRAVVDRIERSYVDTQRKLAPAATRVTDKMPSNFLHLGVIAAAFPRARIIHCIRDARDTCLSCYAQNFGGRHAYADDLAALGHYYRRYERLMAHWKSVVPLPVLDVRYEDVVGDLEGQSRRMVEFLGLRWDAGCLAFHESTRVVRTSSNDQVRRPLYRGSVGRWRKYEAHLGPLLEALGPD